VHRQSAKEGSGQSGGMEARGETRREGRRGQRVEARGSPCPAKAGRRGALPAGGAAGPSPAPPEPACIHGACLGVPAEGHKIQKETRKMTLANVLHLSPVFEWWPSTWDTYPRSMLLTAGSAGEG